MQEQEAKFDQLAQPHLTTISEAAAMAEVDRDAVSALRATTEDLASIAGGDILAGQFQEHSAAERKAAYVAYAIGLAATIGGVIVLLFAFGHATDPLPWQILALKLSITAGIGGIATVAFRFGSKATQRATSFKRQELELRALGPFLANVDGAEAAKIAFAKRAFGHAWEGTATTQSQAPEDVLSKVVDLVKVLSSPAASSKPGG
ncbi:MAG: hypothetical protein BGN97_13925 [Microbacterium sp. 69-10]|nr:MAG: hypothetical protein BGN97_13925 [Microbacterium sp. 69-10]